MRHTHPGWWRMNDCASLVQLALMRHTHLGWQTRAEGKGSSRNAAGLADADQSLPLLCMQRIHDQYVARIPVCGHVSNTHSVCSSMRRTHPGWWKSIDCSSLVRLAHPDLADCGSEGKDSSRVKRTRAFAPLIDCASPVQLAYPMRHARLDGRQG